MPREAAGAGPEDDLAQPRGRRWAGAGAGQRWQLLHQMCCNSFYCTTQTILLAFLMTPSGNVKKQLELEPELYVVFVTF